MSKKKKVINAIDPLLPVDFADQLIADRDNWAWNFAHLSRQEVALRDAGRADTAVAIYIRKAMRAILQHDTNGYVLALDEIVKLCKGL